jgi:mRNA interferase RelE/StbE
MSYKVKLHSDVAKFLGKLPKNISERIKNKLREVRKNPFHYLERYESEDIYKLRIGDYRALIDVDNSRKILFVRVLDKRSKIYKR